MFLWRTNPQHSEVMFIWVSNTPGVSRHTAPIVERKNKKDLVSDDHEVKEMAVLSRRSSEVSSPPWNQLVPGDTSTGSVSISESTVWGAETSSCPSPGIRQSINSPPWPFLCLDCLSGLTSANVNFCFLVLPLRNLVLALSSQCKNSRGL